MTIYSLLLFAATVALAFGQPTKYFDVQLDKVVAPWNHFFENCVGSGHASLALRADYQDQMRKTRSDIGFKQVRFHGLLVDDMSVVLNNNHGDGGVIFSFFNIDRIFDFFVNIGMKPLVEVGFMPGLLASSANATWSHWDANISPPKDWAQWYELISALGKHLVERYGLEEILTWNFEVWNEPNCCPHNFWTGDQQSYFYLFNVTSKALKSVHPDFRVGGPATAMSSWIPEFLNFCRANDVAFDFISTHEYPTDPPGPQTRTFFSDHLKMTRSIVGNDIPIYYTEYDDGYNDATEYSAAFAVYQNYMANGVVDALSWWPFSDIFEEPGLYPDPFNFGTGMPVDGLMNIYGIPKPNYRAFQLMHWSGNQLVQTTPDLFSSNNETVGVFTVTGNGTSIFVVNWNVMNLPCETETVHITVNGLNNWKGQPVVYMIDATHSNAFPLWEEMGRPMYLSPKQVVLLNQASEIVPQSISFTQISSNSISLELQIPPHSVYNIVLQ